MTIPTDMRDQRRSSRHRNITAPRAIRGVGLIEVLVSVTILAFGMLAIAALQATALRNSQSALTRSQAVVQTYAILDAMRANRDVAMIGGYDMGTFDDGETVANWSCNPPDPGSLAMNDRIAWMDALHANLGTSSCAAVDCGTLSCVVAVRWNDARGTGGDSQQELMTRTRL